MGTSVMGTQYEYVTLTERPPLGLSAIRLAFICVGYIVGDWLYMGIDWSATINMIGGSAMFWFIARFVWKCPV